MHVLISVSIFLQFRFLSIICGMQWVVANFLQYVITADVNILKFNTTFIISIRFSAAWAGDIIDCHKVGVT